MRRTPPLLAALLTFGLLTVASAALPAPVVACRCVPAGPMSEYVGNPARVIFAGTVAAAGPAGVDVVVERWYQGGGERFVRLSPDGFAVNGDASCQAPWPVVGGRWIWVAFVPRPGEQPQANGCTPQARLDTVEGAAMLADAEAAFAGRPPSVPDAPSEPSPEVDPATFIAPVVAVGVAALALVAALVAVRRATARSR